MFELGFFLFGLAFGVLLVLAAWYWMLGKQDSTVNYKCYDDELWEYLHPTNTTASTQVDTEVESLPTKSRSKRIRSRKKPASSSRKTRRNK
jgi:uncharacterized membrane protein required for colicin V production